MEKLLKYIYHKTLFGKFLIFVYHNTINYILPDSLHIKRNYKKNFGIYPNLNSPKTLNEKILWLKLHDRNSLQTICADKYAVRKYISKKIGSEYLVPLLYHTFDSKKINFKNTPNIAFIIKTNHDSGGGIIIKNKSKIDWLSIQSLLEKRMKKNYYPSTKEWQYKHIKPRIIIEKLLQDSNGNIPFDYKIHCFNGKVNMIQVDLNRGTEEHYRNWYSKDWKREPYKWSSRKPNGKYTDPSDYEIEKPKTMNEMIRLSEVLSKDFVYVRVDWYDVDGTIYFGELTFHHDGGYSPILPKEWDLKLGDQLKL